MKKLLVAALMLAVFAGVSSAETLLTSDPIGQGRWFLQGSYLMDTGIDFGIGTKVDMNTIGASVGYGVLPALDVIVRAGSATYDKLPAGVSATGTGIGLIGKYAILQESNNMPVSVSAALGYISNSMTVKIPLPVGDQTGSGSTIMAGAGVSKAFGPVTPYAAAAYRSNTMTMGGASANSTQIDLTGGAALNWSADGAVYVEYTVQSVTPDVGTAYSFNQIGAGVSYKI